MTWIRNPSPLTTMPEFSDAPQESGSGIGLVDERPSEDKDLHLDVDRKLGSLEGNESMAARTQGKPGQAAIEGRIQAAFKTSKYPELRKIRICLSDEQTTLFGTVSCYFMKQMAQETIRKLAPTLGVENRLHVKD